MTPIRIVMLADLHNQIFGEKNRELLLAVYRAKPDIICIPGDMLIGHEGTSFKVARDLLVTLAHKYQVYYSLGNHEARMKENPKKYHHAYARYIKPVKEAGVCVLENDCTCINIGDNSIAVYGYELPLKYFEKFNHYPFSWKHVENALGSNKEHRDSYKILLAHHPVYFKEYVTWGADLILSGHLHGGIVRLPGIGGIITPQVKLFPRYSGGLYERDGKSMVVSRGLGTHTIPFRINNKPELSIIDLTPDHEKQALGGLPDKNPHRIKRRKSHGITC